MPAVALTDHGNIFGAVTFFKEAKARDIKPILGCEVYVAPRSRFDKTGDSRDPHHFHLVLLVKNDAGYRNLCHLLSKAYLEGFYYRPRIDKELLSGHTDGLIGLSACLKGEVSFYLDKENRGGGASRRPLEYATFFGPGRLLPRAPGPRPAPAEKRSTPRSSRLARRLDLPLVATNDIHYLRKEDAESHDVLLCIQTNKKLSDQDRIRFSTQEFYFKSGAGDGRALPRGARRHPATRPRSPRNATSAFPRAIISCRMFKPPDETSLEEYLSRVAREGFQARREELDAEVGEGRAASIRSRITKTGWSASSSWSTRWASRATS